MSKPRSDSTLACLTEEQRHQLYDWLFSHSYAEVIKLAARPVNEGGFNLKLHRTTLTRFFEVEQEERQARELAELAASADNAATPSAIEALEEAARDKFIRATYELAKAASDADNYDRLERALHHMDLVKLRREEIELKKRELAQEDARQAEQRRQWEFDAAREVMKNLVEYQKIYRQPNIDEPEKIWQARDIAFGKPPLAENGTVELQPDSRLTHFDTLLHANCPFAPSAPSVVNNSAATASSALCPQS
jgi:hypothetical protein